MAQLPAALHVLGSDFPGGGRPLLRPWGPRHWVLAFREFGKEQEEWLGTPRPTPRCAPEYSSLPWAGSFTCSFAQVLVDPMPSLLQVLGTERGSDGPKSLIGMSVCTYHTPRVRDRRGLICADAQRSIHEHIPNTWNPTPLEHLYSADRCHTSVRLSGILIQSHLSLLGVPVPLPSIQGHMYRWPPVPSPETLLLPGDVGEGSSPEL